MDEEEMLYGNEIEMIDMTGGSAKRDSKKVKKRLNNVLKKCKFDSDLERKQFLLNWINDDGDDEKEADDDENIDEMEVIYNETQIAFINT